MMARHSGRPPSLRRRPALPGFLFLNPYTLKQVFEGTGGRQPPRANAAFGREGEEEDSAAGAGQKPPIFCKMSLRGTRRPS